MKAATNIPLTNVASIINIPSSQEGVDYVYVYDVSHLFDLVSGRNGVRSSYTTHLDDEVLTIFIHDKGTKLTIDGIDRTNKVDNFTVQVYNNNTVVLDLYKDDGHIDTFYFGGDSGMIVEYDGSGRVKIVYNK